MDLSDFGKTRKRNRNGIEVGPSKRRAFTLIELLIVIAIILILIAIALPNFLEAQVRARVTKSKAELRTIGIAMESYALDWKVYPWESENDCDEPQLRTRCGLAWLTDPIAYMTSIPDDTFPDPGGDGREWFETGVLGSPKVFLSAATWAIWTRGPDGLDSELVSDNGSGGVVHQNKGADMSAENYSPTNGTKSLGDIFLFGGDGYYIGTVCSPGVATKANCQGIDPLVVDGVPYLHRLPPDSL